MIIRMQLVALALRAGLQSSAPLTDRFATIEALQNGRGVSPAGRALLLQDLASSTPGPERIKGVLPPGTSIAHKTGTDATRGGKTAATNDIGIVTLPDGRHLAIAVFVKDSTAGLVPRGATIARIAKAAWDHWTAAR